MGVREMFIPVEGGIRILNGWNTEAEGPALEELMVADSTGQRTAGGAQAIGVSVVG